MVVVRLLDANNCKRNVYLALKSSSGKLLVNGLDKYLERTPKADLHRALRYWPSATEHCVLTFYVECSRACMDEMTRHRHLSFTVSSTRYSGYAEPASMEWADSDTAANITGFIGQLLDYYHTLTGEVDVKRQILPLGIRATAIVTGNLRAWRHFYCLRSSPGAHPEIRMVAREIGRIISEELLDGKEPPCPDFNP